MIPKPVMRRSLRILLVSNHRRFKINFRAHPWAHELASRGHDVDVMCHADTERWRTRVESVDGFRIIESPDLLVGALRQGWDPVCALRRRSFLFRESKPYDLIHCLDTRPAVVLPALAYGRAKGVPVVSDWIDWWGHGGLIAERRPWWYRMLFSGVEVFFEEAYRDKLDGLTAISHALVERAIGLGVERQRCIVVPGGANLRAFREIPPRTESRELLGIARSARVVCFSGLDVLIDLPLAVQAFEILLKKDSRTHLLLVGPTAKQVRSMVSDPAIMEHVTATGPVPYGKLAQNLAAADVFLMPYMNKVSNIGRWPNKIGDFMCIGRPTVSNPVGEVEWLFREYGVGKLADETPEAMATAVAAYLDDPDYAEEVGRRARQTAEETFAWERIVDRLETWYYDLLEGRLGPSRFRPKPSPALLTQQQ
jgi:glycosyltransferase involved in cell wall biosynthesis